MPVSQDHREKHNSRLVTFGPESQTTSTDLEIASRFLRRNAITIHSLAFNSFVNTLCVLFIPGMGPRRIGRIVQSYVGHSSDSWSLDMPSSTLLRMFMCVRTMAGASFTVISLMFFWEMHKSVLVKMLCTGWLDSNLLCEIYINNDVFLKRRRNFAHN